MGDDLPWKIMHVLTSPSCLPNKESLLLEIQLTWRGKLLMQSYVAPFLPCCCIFFSSHGKTLNPLEDELWYQLWRNK